jgi:hypothetical protein
MESSQPGDAFLVVAKRMPVRMRVQMDVRKLPLFLCECANSNLPVEIRQVRINAPAGTGGGGMRGGGGGMLGGGGGMLGGGGGGMPGMAGMTGTPGMAGMMGPAGGGGAGGLGAGMAPGMTPGAGGMMGGGMMGGGMMGGGMPGGGMTGGLGTRSGAAAGGVTDSPYDAAVEVYGVIYIYNPVNPERLGIGQDEIDSEADEKSEQAAPPEDQGDVSPDQETVFADPEGIEPGDDDADDAGDDVDDDAFDGMEAGELSPPDPDAADGESSQDEL